MPFTSGKKLGRLLMSELDNNAAFEAGSMQIGNLTKRRIRDTFGRLANTGMSRTGIAGSAIAEIQKAAGESYANLSGQEAGRRSQIINQLLGLYQFQKEQDAQEIGFGDVLGGALGLVTGSALGGFGGSLGKKLSGLLG